MNSPALLPLPRKLARAATLLEAALADSEVLAVPVELRTAVAEFILRALRAIHQAEKLL